MTVIRMSVATVTTPLATKISLRCYSLYNHGINGILTILLNRLLALMKMQGITVAHYLALLQVQVLLVLLPSANSVWIYLIY